MRRILFIVPVLAFTVPLSAEPGLPDAASVEEVLDDHPGVLAAQSRVEAARAQADGLNRGPHEVIVSGGYVRRNVDMGGSFDEYTAGISRAIRLPGKGRIDREIGRHGIEAASNLAEDARHQVALLLANSWYDWLAASAQSKVDRAAVGNFEASLAAVTRQMELREAAQLDVDRARAALSSARRWAEQSEGMAELARSRLAVQFPGLALPLEAPEIPTPSVADARLSQLRDLVVSNSHEIAAAEAETRRMAAVADRLERDRIADPSIGLHAFSEFGGNETGVGVTVSLPLGGGHRRALAQEASAIAGAAQSDETLARYAVEETANADLIEARYRVAAWQRSRESADARTEALLKMRRGYELGEIDLADLLISENMTHDAFRIEAEARAQAMRAITKLRIDSHQLWLGD